MSSQGILSPSRRIRGRIVVALAALGMLAVPASAQAIGFGSLSAQPVSTQAGANTNFNIHIGFTSAADDVKNIVIGLPAGQIGDPTATPKCTVAELNSGPGCAANTQVGSLASNVRLLGLPPDIPVTGELYNLVPGPGEPARFGVILTPVPPLPVGQIKLQSMVELRQTDYGLNTIINDIPNTAAGLVPIDITSMDVTLFGTANGNPFSRNPTSCDLAVTNFSATSYTGATTTTPATGEASYTPTGCDLLPFDPKFSARIEVPDPLDPGAQVQLTTVIEQTAAEAGLRDAKVLVPTDLSPSSDEITNPGELCSPAQFQTHACPPQSVVGSALATSPLLSAPLQGPVTLVQNPGQLVNVGLDLRGELSLLLTGTLGLDNSTTFFNLPDIPIAHFELVFKGGPGGLLAANRNLCLPPEPVFRTDFLGHNGAAVAASTAAPVSGCGPERSPKVTVRLKGARSEHPRLKVKASAASGWLPLRRVIVKLPRGLAFDRGSAGSISASVPGRGLPRKAVRGRGRKLKLKLPSAGSLKAKVSVKGAALKRVGSLSRKRAKFKVKVTDTEGGTVSTKVRARR